MTNAIMNTNDSTAIAPIESLTLTGMYSSVNPSDRAGKIALFNALNSPDESLSEHIGETIQVVDIILHKVELDEEDGTQREGVRTILIAQDGTSYAAVSGGVANAVQRILSVFGSPETWELPLGIKVQQKNTRNGVNKYTTLAVVG